jgi:hypothetical protein
VLRVFCIYWRNIQNRALTKFVYFLLLFSVISCHSSRKALQISSIPNYDPTTKDHIVFLTFEISKNGNTEKVKLINSVAGSGRMKNLAAPVHQLYGISVIRYYSDGQPPIETEHEHPLTKAVEISDPDGSLLKMPLTAHAGTLTVRIQENKALEHIGMYSVGPGKEKRLIYQLKINP